MSLTALNNLAAAASAALEAGDYDLAIRKALACKPLLAVTPELTRGSSGDSQSMAFRSGDAIDSFVREVRKLQTAETAQANGPFTQSFIRYQGAT